IAGGGFADRTGQSGQSLLGVFKIHGLAISGFPHCNQSGRYPQIPPPCTGLRPRLYSFSMHLINEYLAVGNAQDAARPARLITAVLNVAEEIRIEPPVGRTYAWIPFKEFTEPDPLQLDDAVAWLEEHEKDNRLIVCC